MPIPYIRVVFLRVPAFKIFRASYRPLEWGQPVDSSLSVRSLMTAVPCGHGTDRQKRTKDSYEYTHHRVRGLKFPTGTTEIAPSSLSLIHISRNSKRVSAGASGHLCSTTTATRTENCSLVSNPRWRSAEPHGTSG